MCCCLAFLNRRVGECAAAGGSHSCPPDVLLWKFCKQCWTQLVATAAVTGLYLNGPWRQRCKALAAGSGNVHDTPLGLVWRIVSGRLLEWSNFQRRWDHDGRVHDVHLDLASPLPCERGSAGQCSSQWLDGEGTCCIRHSVNTNVSDSVQFVEQPARS